MFNLPNAAIWGQPGSQLGTPNYGVITSTTIGLASGSDWVEVRVLAHAGLRFTSRNPAFRLSAARTVTRPGRFLLRRRLYGREVAVHRFLEQGVEDDQQSAVADSRGLRLSARSEIPHRARHCMADRQRREDDYRRAGERFSCVGACTCAGNHEGAVRDVRPPERRHRAASAGAAGGAVERHAGVFRQANARRRRWRGAFSSTSSITVARSRPICVRWDRPCRKSTGPAPTSLKEEGVCVIHDEKPANWH